MEQERQQVVHQPQPQPSQQQRQPVQPPPQTIPVSDATTEEQAIHHIIEAYVVVPATQADTQAENQEFASAPHSLEAEIFITDYVQQEGQ